MAIITASSSSSLLINPKFSPHSPFLNHFTFFRLSPQIPFSPLSPKPDFSKIRVRVSASSSAPLTPCIPRNNNAPLQFSASTRTITSLFASILALSRVILTKFQSSSNLALFEIQNLQRLRETLVCTVGPSFFAALKDRPSGYLNTPLTVVASGMAKWLDIYSGVLMVRVLLSWFPNIPWDRQPLSAIRDLCDPYLNLFRNIIPPVFDTLDVSPLLAFAVLGTLGSILNNSRGMY